MKFKEEAVFVLESFNDCLVVFFRGQVLVAICVGLCLSIGFSIIGLPYGILLGCWPGSSGSSLTLAIVSQCPCCCCR